MNLLFDHKLAAAVSFGATAFIGYCLYFDNKRRSAPGYKDSIRKKRRGQAGRVVTDDDFDLDINNPERMQNFFIQEMQLGESLMEQGRIEEGAEHLANAIVVCGQPHQILSILQQTLPPDHFAMLMAKYPLARERITRKLSQMTDASGDTGIEEVESNEEIIETKVQELLVDDDVE